MCDSGALFLAQAVTAGLDFGSLEAQTDVTSNTAFASENALFYGGTIITMAESELSPVEALAIGGGKVLAAGTLAEAQKALGSDAKMIDLKRRCILPGFVEPHLHLILTALTIEYFVNLQPSHVTSCKHAIDILTEAARKAKPGSWVAAFGYDPSRITGHDELTADLLDTACTAIPILVINQSGHLAYVNHKAFDTAGVTDQTPDPPGGTYVKVGGKLTGRIEETPAIATFGNLVPKPPVQDYAKWCKATLGTWSSKGCTTIFDAGIGVVAQEADLKLLATITSKSNLPVRFIGALAYTIAPALDSAMKLPYWVGGVKIQAIKLWADGSTQGFTAALKEPYKGRKCWKGKLNMTDVELESVMGSRLGQGWQLLVYSNGDRATEQALNAYKKIFGEHPNRDKTIMHRIEHFTVTEPEQLAIAKELGLGISHTIGHVYYWGDTFKHWVLGAKRAERIDPVREDLDHGLVYSFHSDSPVTEVDPLLYVHTAMTRQMYKIDPREILGEAQCVELTAALRGITINPAKQVLMADSIGSLEVGKSADLVIIDQDPQVIGADKLGSLNILETWFAGCRVYQKTPEYKETM